MVAQIATESLRCMFNRQKSLRACRFCSIGVTTRKILRDRGCPFNGNSLNLWLSSEDHQPVYSKSDERRSRKNME